MVLDLSKIFDFDFTAIVLLSLLLYVAYLCEVSSVLP